MKLVESEAVGAGEGLDGGGEEDVAVGAGGSFWVISPSQNLAILISRSERPDRPVERCLCVVHPT